MKALDENTVQNELQKLPAWQRKGLGIERELQFPSFMAAIAFVDRLAVEAERADHHPDILIRYNKVLVSMWTHDANGLTLRDFGLAARCNELSGL